MIRTRHARNRGANPCSPFPLLRAEGIWEKLIALELWLATDPPRTSEITYENHLFGEGSIGKGGLCVKHCGKDVVVIKTAKRKTNILGHVDTFERY